MQIENNKMNFPIKIKNLDVILMQFKMKKKIIKHPEIWKKHEL